MWYFTWILGTAAAILFAVVNAMWLEAQEEKRRGN
ncbi:MAG: cytochrome bd-I oxidase subunit CydX [Corticimicrobacter sp.]|uniref:Cytochrome bd-I oxidase subunit CydX n=1 Tax=Corticimicrobacter populi TaxID=2175229 RepID=A0A2V1JVI1_9BURK|nr:cytochrome bd-I oxidase subunit CydX [Corticimicrobacter populi]PWF22210.1 cytochrome bd-I oxidase subunit CydX [Corticimicrobacter populi]QDQ86278.1 cytochrome bd-I oxidase subunit CydX [Alcaligenaceae bacterium SJ-26]